MNDTALARSFLGVPLHAITVKAFMATLVEACKPSNKSRGVTTKGPSAADAASRPLRVTYLNAHCSNMAARDAAYRDILRRCDIVYADGQGVVWGARALGVGVPERVNAGDFIVEFCQRCAAERLSIFLLGCAEGLAERAAENWQQAALGLKIAGMHHGYFSHEEEAAVVEMINRAKPDIVLVGMSVPRQEEFMDRWAAQLDVSVVWCVGALFEYYSGERYRAPVWVRRIGMEWLVRLCLEPKRLFGRYVVGNLVFVGRVMRGRFWGDKG